MSESTRELLLRKLTNLVSRPDLELSDFESIMRHEVRDLIPHKGCIVGYGTVLPDQNQIYMNDFVAIDYNIEMLKQLNVNTSFIERPLLGYWLKGQRPMLVTVDNCQHIASPFELFEMSYFGLTPMLIHGQKDLCGHMSSYFSFSQCTADPEEACANLAIVMPFLHLLLTRVMAKKRTYQRYNLSTKEAQVMGYLCKGYTNKEIAEFLACSPFTIKNQVAQILKKMNASNRAEAIYLFNTVFQGE